MHCAGDVSNEDGDGVRIAGRVGLRVDTECMFRLASTDQKVLGRWRRSVPDGFDQAFPSGHRKAERTFGMAREAAKVVSGSAWSRSEGGAVQPDPSLSRSTG